jgi:RNA polymerase sigma factor (sigma-70 family)
MRQDTVSQVSERLLCLAQECFSGALQFDYLSDGRGYKRSTPLRALRAAAPASASQGHGGDIVRRYLCEVATRKRLTSAEEYRLAARAAKGDHQARRRLIEHHLGLVVMLARRYGNRGLPLLDLIEEGNLGLLRAAQKFDPERGCRFSSYAKWWIRQAIELALMTQKGAVRVPVHVARESKRRARLASPGQPSASPPSEPTETSDTALASIVAPEHEQPEWLLHLASQRTQLERALLQLKTIERNVLEARFGLPDDATRTLQSIGRQLNLSSERVRQIEAEALGKLRKILSLEDSSGA